MGRFTTSDGVALHYDDHGSGTPILCLAGLTRNATDFDYVLPHLPDNRLIRLDYRGRGRSARAPWESYTIPVEARDALELLDHLELEKAAILGTSRGGLIAMFLAATARHRLIGAALNDIGPEIAPEGLEAIKGYIGRNPAAQTHAEAAALMESRMAGFANVPPTRWAEEAAKHYIATAEGLTINYDPALARAVEAAGAQPAPDLWPLFDAMAGLPLALIRGANSDLLTPQTAAEMRRRRPDMIFAEVPDRGHIPFLDEAPALAALHEWTTRL
ncbi:alpha/beta fold hydrolase [Oceaniglobus trochenteri]|uniref:alpha/beta fold hydrolase n=1 Tax=Oceaniglobus trochenteri TaxID=2763260 RepID=UPI001CFFC6E5|nr:alpha/beta hydrolase [Oceaniglobus trochenteri]